MSLEKIIERIEHDAQAQIDEIKNKASAEADRIIQSAKEEAESFRAQALEGARKEAEQRKQRLISSANLEFRKELLAEKQNAIDSAFQEAIDTLLNMEDAEYKRVIKKMIMSSVQTGDEEIVLSKRDKARLNNDFLNEVNSQLAKDGKKGNLTISEDTYEISGGFILRRGSIEINNSFESLFKSSRDDLESEVAKLLFEG